MKKLKVGQLFVEKKTGDLFEIRKVKSAFGGIELISRSSSLYTLVFTVLEYLEKDFVYVGEL